MIDKVDDVDAYVEALLDITNNNYVKAAQIVCRDIQTKELPLQILKHQI